MSMIFIHIRIMFSSLPLLLKVVYKYSQNIHELLWSVKVENGLLGKNTKDMKHKMGTYFASQPIFFNKNYPSTPLNKYIVY